jgi:hypothetical protein
MATGRMMLSGRNLLDLEITYLMCTVRLLLACSLAHITIGGNASKLFASLLTWTIDGNYYY